MDRKITFVIGAGASFDFGFPLGSALKDLIYGEMDDFIHRRTRTTGMLSKHISSICQKSPAGNRAQTVSKYEDAAKKIMHAIHGFDSIDSMLRVHADDGMVVTMAKLAITIIIADHENKSLKQVSGLDVSNKAKVASYVVGGSQSSDLGLAPPPIQHYRDKIQKVIHNKECWTNEFARLLNSLGSTEAVERALESCTFVIFNYDRCAEFYLACSLQAAHLISSERAWEIVKKAKFIHPYGSVGDLPSMGGEHSHDFGDELTLQKLNLVSSSLRTFSEGVDDEELKEDIHQAVLGSHNLIFLGFGFLRMNMDLLLGEGIGKTHPASKSAIASVKDVTASDVEIIRSNLTGLKLRAFKPITEDKTCVELIQAHKMRLNQMFEDAIRN